MAGRVRSRRASFNGAALVRVRRESARAAADMLPALASTGPHS